MSIVISGLGGCPIRLESIQKVTPERVTRIQKLITKQNEVYQEAWDTVAAYDTVYQVAPEVAEYFSKYVY